MLVLLSAICWLYKKDKLKRFFSSLQVIGRMTLTNYLMQNLIGLILFSGFGFNLLLQLPFYAFVLLAVVIFVSQVYLSRWWLSKYNYGPVEWIWRQMSYGKMLPLRK